MISYIDIVQFLMLGIVLVFGAGHILSLRTMNKFLDEHLEAGSTMYDLWRENRDDIIELKDRFNQMRAAGIKLEDDLKEVFNSNGIVYANPYQGSVTIDDNKEGQI